MEKIVKKQTSILKRILIIIGIIIAVPIIGLIILLLMQPIIDGIDHSKFISLQNQSRLIYNDLQKAAAGADNWQYEAKCSPERAGDWSTGSYYCSTTSSLRLSITSANQIEALHDKYFSIIDGSKSLKPIDNLSKVQPSQFGTQFVISTAGRQYKTTDGYTCTYSAELGQPNEPGIPYGTPISGNVGQATLMFDCTGKAKGDWYK